MNKIKYKIKEHILKTYPKKYIIQAKDIISNIIDVYHLKSYSQEGEDMILRRIFEKQNTGFYVDVGANHPRRFSNTYFFYRKGWSGINIDATPGSMKKFNYYRSRDINVEAAIAKEKKEMTFYLFDDPALNTFDKNLAQIVKDSEKFKLVDQKKLVTQKISDILDAHLPENQLIDFMSIDIEGLDMETLESNNWQKYIPKFILIEQKNFNIEQINSNKIYQILKNQGYSLFAKTFNTLFFEHESRY